MRLTMEAPRTTIVRGRVMAHNGSGAIEATDGAGPIDAMPASGAIRLSHVQPAVTRAHARSGAIKVTLASGAGHDFLAQSESGKIFVSGLGHDDATRDNYPSPNGKLGGGGPLVDIRTIFAPFT